MVWMASCLRLLILLVGWLRVREDFRFWILDSNQKFKIQNSEASDIEIQGKFIRMGSESEGIDFLLAFVPDPRLDHVVGEHLALQEKLVVVLEMVQRLFQRGR